MFRGHHRGGRRKHKVAHIKLFHEAKQQLGTVRNIFKVPQRLRCWLSHCVEPCEVHYGFNTAREFREPCLERSVCVEKIDVPRTAAPLSTARKLAQPTETQNWSD